MSTICNASASVRWFLRGGRRAGMDASRMGVSSRSELVCSVCELLASAKMTMATAPQTAAAAEIAATRAGEARAVLVDMRGSLFCLAASCFAGQLCELAPLALTLFHSDFCSARHSMDGNRGRGVCLLAHKQVGVGVVRAAREHLTNSNCKGVSLSAMALLCMRACECVRVAHERRCDSRLFSWPVCYLKYASAAASAHT